MGKGFASPIIILLIILPLLGFFLGTKFGTKSDELATTKTQLAETQKDLELSNYDRAKLIKTYSMQYSVADFPIRSELFQDKEFQVKEWLYKGRISAKQYSLELKSEDERNPFKVTIWDSRLNANDVGDFYLNKALIFDGMGNALDISNNQNSEQLFYKAKTGIIWNRTYGELNRFKNDNTSVHQVYVQVIGGPAAGLFMLDDTNTHIISTTKELEPIADKIIN